MGAEEKPNDALSRVVSESRIQSIAKYLSIYVIVILSVVVYFKENEVKEKQKIIDALNAQTINDLKEVNKQQAQTLNAQREIMLQATRNNEYAQQTERKISQNAQ